MSSFILTVLYECFRCIGLDDVCTWTQHERRVCVAFVSCLCFNVAEVSPWTCQEAKGWSASSAWMTKMLLSSPNVWKTTGALQVSPPIREASNTSGYTNVLFYFNRSWCELQQHYRRRVQTLCGPFTGKRGGFQLTCVRGPAQKATPDSLNFIEQDDSTLNSLDLRFNDCQADGATVLAKSLQVQMQRSTCYI